MRVNKVHWPRHLARRKKGSGGAGKRGVDRTILRSSAREAVRARGRYNRTNVPTASPETPKGE